MQLCRRHIEREGWKVVAIYTDRAISGSVKQRPEYQKLLRGVQERKFDLVVAEALDRLSCDQEDTAALFKRLSFSGIKLITRTSGC